MTLCDQLKPLSNFEDAVRLTIAVAKELFGATEAKAVEEGWKAVGL
jgi:Zn-dependent metalloprotease